MGNTTFPGEVRQLGYVTRDIEEAMAHLTRQLGVGPFFYFETARIDDFVFRGKPREAIVSVAFANLGRMQIELIQERNDAPSSYAKHLATGSEGLQHLAYWTTSFDEDFARALAAGLAVLQTGISGGDPDGRHAYFDTAGHPGTIVEPSEISGRKGDFYRHIERTAASWDGSDAIRRLD